MEVDAESHWVGLRPPSGFATAAKLARGAGRLDFVGVSRQLLEVISLNRWICSLQRRFRPCPALCLAVGLLVGTVSLHAAAPEWHVLDTPRFTVVSQLPEQATRAWAEEFNQFIDALNQMITVNDKFLPRLTVVIFAKDKDFQAYLPAQTSKNQAKLAGYFWRHESWAVITMANLSTDRMTRETIFHEGVHWLLSIYPRYLPLCINEGLAEVFSTFKVEKAGAQWGWPIQEYIALLRMNMNTMMPMNELLLTSADAKNYHEEDRAQLFYAQSWLFVHYLLFGERRGARTALDDFLLSYSKGGTTEEAFRQAFGTDYDGMSARLKTYMLIGKYAPGIIKSDETRKLAVDFVSASPAVVEMAMAKLAFASGRKEAAMKHAQTAVQLVPEDPACYDTLACLQNQDDPEQGGLEAAQKAVALGSNDGWSYLIVAQARVRSALALGGIPAAESREIADQIETGLRPHMRSGYLFLADVFSSVDHFTKDDVIVLRQGLMMFPDEVFIYTGLANIARKHGDKPMAQKLLAVTLKKIDRLELRDRDYVRNLQQTWLFQDIGEQVVPLADAGKYQEAVDVLDEYLKNELLSRELKIELLRKREPLAVSALMAKAREAHKAGQFDEERRLLNEVADNPKALASVRNVARDRLRILDEKAKRGPGPKPDAASEQKQE